MDHLWQDLRYAARRLLNARWFTLAAIVTLSLGIGANTTVFTFVNAVLLRGLPFDDQERIVAVWMENERNQESGVSYPDFADFREQATSFESMAVLLNSTVNISETGRVPEQVSGAYVSHDFFRVIGEETVLGRGFGEQDDREESPPVVLIGHALWQSRYDSDPGIIGHAIKVNSLFATIVGVMPEGMRFPEDTGVWIPRANLPPEQNVDDRGARSFSVIGRLAPGVSMEQAREQLRLIAAGLATEYPATNENRTADLESYQQRMNGGEIRIVFLSLMGAVAFVLLIACANVANLLLAKAAQRTREMAVRVSVGATRARLVRQLLVESLLLAVVAGFIGLGLSVAGIRWFDANTQDVGKPYWMEFSMDPVVFLYTGLICLATVLLSGLAPAMQVSNTQVSEVMKEGGRGGSSGFRARRWSAVLVVSQLVLTLVLLSGAAFMMRSFLTLYRMDPGIDTSRMLTMELYLPLTQYPEPGPRQLLYENLERRLAEVPLIEVSALTTSAPLSGGATAPLELAGGEAVLPENRPFVTSVSVGDRYFDITAIPLLSGRMFQEGDGLPGAEVAIVNQRFADLHLTGDPLGRQFRLGAPPAGGTPAPYLTIVGVVPNVRQTSLEDTEPDPVVYRPLRSNPARGVILLLRTSATPAAAATAVREAVATVDPDLPVFDIRTMDERLADSRWPFRVFGAMFSLFAVVALLLSAVGLYSVTAHSVIQRTQEFGIRMALGAQSREISWLALRRVLIHLGIGIPLGVLGALGVGQILQSLLVQTSPRDPVTLVLIVLILAAVAVAACIWPARRAAQLDPLVALRVD